MFLGYPGKNQGDGAMLTKMARATFLLTLAVMVVAWALSLGKSEAQAPQNEQPAQVWDIYS
jgi:hypothetical protein